VNRVAWRLAQVASLALVVAAAAWAWRGGPERADLAPAASTHRSATTTPATSGAASPSTTAPAPPAPRRPGVPRRIRIPSLGIDAPVVSVGREADGSMEVPSAHEAGWYGAGPRPGESAGSAVIAAHVDYDGRPGAFFTLRNAQPGAPVVVTDASGQDHRFVVSERAQVAKGRLPADELFRTGGGPVLTLITCGGTFDRHARSYADNIVIRAQPL
jgi:sortase (surface protein transpeptidase)